MFCVLDSVVWILFFGIYQIRSQAEPVNDFWTLTVKNYCSTFLSTNACAGGLIHAASGKAEGIGIPFTDRSG